MGHIRIFEMKFGSFSSCFSPLPQLFVFQQGRSSPSMTAPEISTWHQSRSHFHLTPKNAWTQYQLPKWKKSPNKNSLMPSKPVNFRMLHTFLYYFDYFDHFLNKL